MQSKHKRFLDDVEKSASKEDIRYFAAAIEEGDVHYCGRCGTVDIKALIYVIATEYPEEFKEISSYIDSEKGSN